MSYENCFDEIFEGEGKYDIPIILPVTEIGVTGWELFENARHAKPQQNVPANMDYRQELGVHFFQDDHKFEIVWSQPRKHLGKLRMYGCVLSPDFSMFVDFPMAVQIMQAYKRHWVARFWQEQGLTVIPTICWSTPESYEWCFDGEPHNSIVAVADIGCTRNPEARELFRKGYDEMISRLSPSKVLFFTYGRGEKDFSGNVEYINIKQMKNFLGGEQWVAEEEG